MLLAPTPIAAQLKTLARRFLTHIGDRNYDLIWNHLLTLDAMELISTATFPLHLHGLGQIDAFLAQPSAIDGMALAFQQDSTLADDDKGVRTSFFDGVAVALERQGWFKPFADEASFVFLHGSDAVLIADTHENGGKVLLWFVDEGHREYKIDLEAFAAFSMSISAQKLHRLATRAMELGHIRIALQMYGLASRLSATYNRIRQLGWDHPLIEQYVTEQRKHELQAEYAYTILAKEQLAALLADPQVVAPTIELGSFLRDTFRGYNRITETDVDEQDMQRLIDMDDSALRPAVAQLLIGVDPVEAQREARKPHTSAEIADMEVVVNRGGDLYHLLMLFKSGREIRVDRVPVDVFYQIFRAHMFFEKGVVVFITAKPCSHPLHNLIKLARDRKGWPIGVIEHQDLACLLKLNSLL